MRPSRHAKIQCKHTDWSLFPCLLGYDTVDEADSVQSFLYFMNNEQDLKERD